MMAPSQAPKNEEENRGTLENKEDALYLFTTKTCPNCRAAKEALKGMDYVTIDAEENQELAEKYGIMQAPTLVQIEGNHVKKIVNASNIRKFAETVEIKAMQY